MDAKVRKGRNTQLNQAELVGFKHFIDQMEVVDIPVLGKNFTWFSSDGASMSRLDRFLLSEGVIQKWDITAQSVGDKDISDHYPIWLKGGEMNWGPKPFRFNNCWLEHNGFCDFVKTCWENFQVEGWSGFVLKQKLKLLKEKLQWWNEEVFGMVDLRIDESVLGLNSLDELVANGGVPKLEQRRVLNAQFWNLLHKKESNLLQKSRTKWLQEGDANTSYFHSSVKSRRRRNQLTALRWGTLGWKSLRI